MTRIGPNPSTYSGKLGALASNFKGADSNHNGKLNKDEVHTFLGKNKDKKPSPDEQKQNANIEGFANWHSRKNGVSEKDLKEAKGRLDKGDKPDDVLKEPQGLPFL